jgi:3-oxoacyl-[acyl-carrier protein] reductase
LRPKGANLALCDLNLEGVTETAQAAEAYGVRTVVQRTDVSDREQIEALVSGAIEAFGTVDVLVNNAGMFYNAPFEEQTDDQWDTIMAVNVKSVFMLSQAVIRHWLAAERGGSIVNSGVD